MQGAMVEALGSMVLTVSLRRMARPHVADHAAAGRTWAIDASNITKTHSFGV